MCSTRAAHPDQPLREPPRHGAVRDQRADQGQADLSAVRVAGDDQVVAERGRLGRRVGRVHHREPEPVGRAPRRHPEVVPADVGVVEAEQLDRQPVEVDLAADVREVAPAVGAQLRDQLGAPGPARRDGACRCVGSTRGSSAAGARSSRSIRARTTTRAARARAARPSTRVSTASGSARKSPVTTVTSAAGSPARNAAFRGSSRTKCRSDRCSTVKGPATAPPVGWRGGAAPAGTSGVRSRTPYEHAADARRSDAPRARRGSTGGSVVTRLAAEDRDPRADDRGHEGRRQGARSARSAC